MFFRKHYFFIGKYNNLADSQIRFKYWVKSWLKKNIELELVAVIYFLKKKIFNSVLIYGKIEPNFLNMNFAETCGELFKVTSQNCFTSFKNIVFTVDD